MFFSSSFIRRDEAVILELHKGSVYNSVKFQIRNKSSKNEHTFSKRTNISFKWARKGHDLRNQKRLKTNAKIHTWAIPCQRSEEKGQRQKVDFFNKM